MIRCPGWNGAQTPQQPYQIQPIVEADMATIKIRQCSHCDKVFSFTDKRRGDFCSQACWKSAIKATPITCEQCSSVFTPIKYSKRHGKFISSNRFLAGRRWFCSVTCSRKAKHTAAKHCQHCGVLFTPICFSVSKGRFIGFKKRKTCSDQCRHEVRVSRNGSQSYLWKGGISWLSNSGYRGRDWKIIAEAARKRSGYRCQRCNKTQDDNGQLLDVHHKIPFFNFVDSRQANKPKNLRVVCLNCHRTEESQFIHKQFVLPLGTGFFHSGVLRGERVHSSKLTNSQVMEIRRRRAFGESREILSREFGVNQANISAVVTGRLWKHLPLVPAEK